MCHRYSFCHSVNLYCCALLLTEIFSFTAGLKRNPKLMFKNLKEFGTRKNIGKKCMITSIVRQAATDVTHEVMDATTVQR